jgi:predicted amino acid racemase
MRYPALLIDKAKLEENTKTVLKNCKAYGIDVAAVTKCYCAIPELAEAQVKAGVKMLADSRVENLKKLKDIPVTKMLIRIPMISQAADVVKYADISLNSEIQVIKALSAEAVKQGKKHKVMMMIDIGDLREGCLFEDALALADQIIAQEGIILAGIGANYSCFGGVLADRHNLGQLLEIKDKVEKKHNITIELVSGGNSCTYHVMEAGEIPAGVNHFRLGELIILGYDVQMNRAYEGAHRDVFTLAAEIVELKEKPSKPFGKIGVDAFGCVPVFPDYGIRKRAILAIGRQDCKIDDITPRTQGATIVGASSDHMIVDLTDCTGTFKVGDVLEFDVAYGALLALSTSEYVSKNIV